MDYSRSETAINGMYSISLRLPDTMDTSNVLGVVYLRSDGGIEYFECNSDQGTLSFDIPHFSSFYIVSEKVVNLLPLILIFSTILLLEVAVIAFIWIRRKKESSTTSFASFVPFLPVFAAAKITPIGAIPTVISLGILIVCAGGVIAWLIADELKKKSKAQEKQKNAKALPSPDKVPIISLPDGMENHSQISAPTHEENNENTDTEITLSKICPDPDTVLVLDTVSVEEANDLMSDAEAKASLKEISSDEIQFSNYSMTGKKYEVNIDVISAAFLPNETVSLQSLKEKRLISKNAKAVKILARGTLDKPLTVIAQDFSTAAIKMITLTGGHAMIVERE